MELVKLLFVCMLIFGIVWLFFNKKPEVWRNVTGWIEARKEGTIYSCVFLLVLLSQIWLPFLRHLSISGDEAYTISGAAYFAGYNWSAYMHMKKFYNFGYSMLLAPLYKIFDDSVTIYRMMLLCNVFVHAVTALMIYHVLRAKLKCSKCFSIAVSLVSACNALVLFFRGFVYNELPLAFVVWLILLLLLELVESKGRKRILLSAVLGGVAAYAYIIHSRCIIIYAALCLLVLLYLAVYKKWLVQPVSFAIIFVPMVHLEKMLVDYIQQHLYLQDSGTVMRNSVEHVATGTWRYMALFSLDGIKRLICNFFSLAGTTSIKTGGVLTIVTVVVLYYMIKNISGYRKGEVDKSIFIVSLFSTISLWGMVVAIALTGASNGRIRFLAYTRYFVPFLGPFLMCGLVLLKKYTQFSFKWIVIWSVLLTLIVCGVYLFYTYPILDGESSNEITSFFFFRVFGRDTAKKVIKRSVFIISLSLLVAFTAGLLFLYKRKQMMAFCVAAMIFSICLFGKVEEIKCIPASEKRTTLVDAGAWVVENKEAYGIENVYCVGVDQYKKTLLMVCYDDDVIYDVKNIQPGPGDVAVGNSEQLILQYNPKYIYQLDKNEWIGLWDDTLNTIFKAQYN